MSSTRIRRFLTRRAQRARSGDGKRGCIGTEICSLVFCSSVFSESSVCQKRFSGSTMIPDHPTGDAPQHRIIFSISFFVHPGAFLWLSELLSLVIKRASRGAGRTRQGTAVATGASRPRRAGRDERERAGASESKCRGYRQKSPRLALRLPPRFPGPAPYDNVSAFACARAIARNPLETIPDAARSAQNDAAISFTLPGRADAHALNCS